MMSIPMQPRTRTYRYLALISWIILLGWMVIWHFILPDNPVYSPWFLLLMWVVPLLLPAAGLLKARPYTHAWANFIVMFYLLHGITTFYAVPQDRYYAAVELVAAISMFIGCSFFARSRGRELGLGLKKPQE